MINRNCVGTGGSRRELTDLTSCLDADLKLCDLYVNSDGRARRATLNVAGSGTFRSDRTSAQYTAVV
jgi:hypothetical protein